MDRREIANAWLVPAMHVVLHESASLAITTVVQELLGQVAGRGHAEPQAGALPTNDLFTNVRKISAATENQKVT